MGLKKKKLARVVNPEIKLTLEQATAAFAVPLETLRRCLRGLGCETGRGVLYTIHTIYRALAGELDAEKTRETRARADLLEMERKEKQGELVSMSEVERLYTEALLPVRQRFLALPAEAATRCNPTDPQCAREALQQWVDDALPMIRERLPKK